MNIDKFYEFDSKLSFSTFQASPINLSDKEDRNGLSDQYRLIQGVYKNIIFPVIFKQEYGYKLRDILDTGCPGLCLISDRIKTILEENDLTGWKTFEIKVLDKHEQEIPGYYGLSITGRCGKIDYSKSEIIEKQLVPNGPLTKYYKGLYVGLDKWDGSDFFLPEKYFGAIVTTKAANILKKSKNVNVELNNLAEIETPCYILK